MLLFELRGDKRSAEQLEGEHDADRKRAFEAGKKAINPEVLERLRQEPTIARGVGVAATLGAPLRLPPGPEREMRKWGQSPNSTHVPITVCPFVSETALTRDLPQPLVRRVYALYNLHVATALWADFRVSTRNQRTHHRSRYFVCTACRIRAGNLGIQFEPPQSLTSYLRETSSSSQTRITLVLLGLAVNGSDLAPGFCLLFHARRHLMRPLLLTTQR